MKKTVLVMLAAAVAATTAFAADDNWVDMFNGENLDGWKSEGGTAKYTVEDGMIVGTTVDGSPNTFLCRGPYSDFVFVCEVKCDTPLNSGIQFRSHVWKKDIEQYMKRGQSNIGVVYGYQCEISPDKPHRCGHVWDEHRRRTWLDTFKDKKGASNPYKVGEWNRYRIKVEGNHIETWINGKKVADFKDDMDAHGLVSIWEPGECFQRKTRVFCVLVFWLQTVSNACKSRSCLRHVDSQTPRSADSGHPNAKQAQIKLATCQAKRPRTDPGLAWA